MEEAAREALVDEVIQAQKSIFHVIQAATTPAWIELDLTMAQIKGLFSLSKVGTSTVGDLAEALGIGRPAASILVDRLVNLDLAEREEDEADRRRTFVRLSPKGERLAEQLRSGREELVRGWLKQIAADDLAAFARGLRAIQTVATKNSPAGRY